MESVGQKLRAARLRLGFTLEHISASTRITLKSLSAIEADAVDQISSRFLYRSFVRQFAEAVGLSLDELRDELDAALSHIPEPLLPGQDGSPIPPKLPSLRASHVRLSRWVSSFLLLLAMLAACSTVYALWHNSRGITLRASSATFHWPPAWISQHHVATTATAAPSVSKSSILSSEGLQPKPETIHPDAIGDAPVRVELCALERTWLSVVADGKEVYSGTLQASESKHMESQQMQRIRTGNAGGVEIVFNGKKLGALGSRGQVQTVVFERNGYHIVSSAQHLALATLGVAPSSAFGE